MTPEDRSLKFRSRPNNRYWWYRLQDTSYVPPIFAGLGDDEWQIMDQWFEDTEAKFPSPGEVSIPGISLLAALIGGNGVGAVVQCGHYVGFSTLLLGFLLRRMSKRNALFSIDIDEASTAYTEKWIQRAGLGDQVRLEICSSSDAALPEAALAFFGRAPQIVFIDSSHQHAHTIEELDLWYEALRPGGLIVMHDVSTFAQSFDATGSGGVQNAVKDWARTRGLTPFLMNSFVTSQPPDDLVYKDGCGIGLLQKAMG